MRSAQRAVTSVLKVVVGIAQGPAPIAHARCVAVAIRLPGQLHVAPGGPSTSASAGNIPCWAGPVSAGIIAGHAQRRSFLSALKAPGKKVYTERRLIGYSPEQLYSVVADVEQYQRFVPWCVRSAVLRRSGSSYMEAEMEVGFQVFVERYISKVTLQPPGAGGADLPGEVRTAVSDSTLFDHLDCTWRMAPGPTPDSCWLSFHIDFAFSSPLYRHIADVFFSEVVQRMMGAFEGRCRSLYGADSLAAAHAAAARGRNAAAVGACAGSSAQELQPHRVHRHHRAGHASSAAAHNHRAGGSHHRPWRGSSGAGAAATHADGRDLAPAVAGVGTSHALLPRLQPSKLPTASGNNCGLTGLVDDAHSGR